MQTHVFDGLIAGLGTTSGTRLVVGHWPRSPLGAFTDVMVERPDGHRLLLAPSREVADFVVATYTFDETRIEPVDAVVAFTSWHVVTDTLDLRLEVGGRHPVSWPLALVPRPVGESRRWAGLVDPLARRLMPGVRTLGTAGGGRTEWYAARSVRRIAAARGTWEGGDLGALAPVDPPVRFGFGSAPRTPTVTRLRSFVRVP